MAKPTHENPESDLDSGIHALKSRGPKTAAVVSRLAAKLKTNQLFRHLIDQDLRDIADSLKRWTDDAAAELLTELESTLAAPGLEIEVQALCKWIALHENDPDSVCQCVDASPPQGVDIIKVLSRKGSQKIVFLATWGLTQKIVVLKRLRGALVALQREKLTAYLPIRHPKIIDTRFQQNSKGEEFLIEDYIPDVLSDEWPANGILEASNLLYDIADALNYLHTGLDECWVHGDVKPDNIARRSNTYVLLDFGIARQASQFAAEVTATGSLRTRAPELFLMDRYDHPEKSDVWALGATVFNAVTGRFPLLDRGERVPRSSEGDEKRRGFEALLKCRVNSEWNVRVALGDVEEPLRGVLELALKRDPNERASASKLLRVAEKELSAYLRSRSEIRRFSPNEEVSQLIRFLPRESTVGSMPRDRRTAIVAKIGHLHRNPNITAEERLELTNLASHLTAT